MGNKKTLADNERVVIWDIAQRSGVSIATVSRVLNGRPDVAPATRDKVMKHVRELGYVSKHGTEEQSTTETRYIGLMAPFISGAFFGGIVEGAAQAVEQHGARLTLCLTQGMHEHETAIMKNLGRNGLEGLLLVVAGQSQQELTRLRKRGYPFVVIDPYLPLPEDIPVISAANIQGGRTATEHLLALGHRRIGVITGRADCRATIDRLAGFHSVQVRAGLANRPELTVCGNFCAKGGYKAAHQLLSQPDAPTAIFALNDDMALGALQAAQERGLRVPEELSIIGFDDNTFARVATPALTTVRQPLHEMGRGGVEMLYRLIGGQQLEATHVELSTRLVVRASTAECRQAA